MQEAISRVAQRKLDKLSEALKQAGYGVEGPELVYQAFTDKLNRFCRQFGARSGRERFNDFLERCKLNLLFAAQEFQAQNLLTTWPPGVFAEEEPRSAPPGFISRFRESEPLEDGRPVARHRSRRQCTACEQFFDAEAGQNICPTCRESEEDFLDELFRL